MIHSIYRLFIYKSCNLLIFTGDLNWHYYIVLTIPEMLASYNVRCIKLKLIKTLCINHD